MYDLKYRIRVICMEDFEQVTNVDEYIGFILGIISQDHDIEMVFIDSILKHADISVDNLEDFFGRLSAISATFGLDFIISVSAEKEELGEYINKYEILN